MGTWIFLLIIIAVVFWAISAYNTLIRMKGETQNAWKQIDVQLKRRHDLLPKLVAVVKAYASFEEKLLRDVTGARSGSGSAGERARAENALTGQFRQLLAVAEAYPDLKANRAFLDLQGQISDAEEQIQYARRYYNGTVRELNILVQSFPSNLVARLSGFALMEYFEIELATQRESPELDFS